MATVLQIEHSPSLLSIRRSILRRNGYSVISVLGTADAWAPSIMRQSIGVIVIGHGAAWRDRQELISHFRESLPDIPVIAMLRRNDVVFDRADFNCPCDAPPLWLRTVDQATSDQYWPRNRVLEKCE